MASASLWESFRWPDETVTRTFTIMTTGYAVRGKIDERCKRRGKNPDGR
jgi:hypothetical protein